MKYRNMKVKDCCQEQLLFELIQRNKLADGPKKSSYSGVWKEVIVGIGTNHTAQIRLPEEDVRALKSLVAAID